MFGVGVECKLFNSFKNKVKKKCIMRNLKTDVEKWNKLPWKMFQKILFMIKIGVIYKD